MNRERYLSLMRWANDMKSIKFVICGMTKCIPFLLAFFYIFSIIFCILMYPVSLLRLIFHPLLCFITVTFLRNLIKAPRPYDVFDFIPLCGYHPGKNKSFPSRHTASAAILALEISHIFGGVIGIICIILALIMGVFRVLCGNHFIKDVIAGYFVALFFYFL